MRKRLTEEVIAHLRPAATGRRYIVMDSVVAGLGVRVSPTGRKTFVLIARFNSNHPTRRSLGTCGRTSLDDARAKAISWQQQLAKGQDPARPPDQTFGAVCERFAAHISKQRRVKDFQQCADREFLPRWKDKPIAEVTRADLLKMTDAALARGSPYAAHNAWAHARRLFNYAIARGVLDRSPCDRVRPRDIIGAKEPRQRVLTDDELRVLWDASARVGYPYGPLWQLLLVTGQRKSEIANARWDEIHDGVLTIPPERFKSNAMHMVPLSPLAMRIIEGLPRTSDRLFGHINGFSKAKKRLDREMDVREHFVIHDIRRTVRTRLSSLRVRHEVAEMVIGHGRKGLARVYDQHHYADEMREALDAWTDRLSHLVNERQDIDERPDNGGRYADDEQQRTSDTHRNAAPAALETLPRIVSEERSHNHQ